MDYSDFSEDEDFVELAAILIERPRRPRVYANDLDKWTDSQFFNRFRFSKNGFQFVLETVRPFLPHRFDRRGCPLSHEQMLLMTLNFYASGAFMRVVGDNHQISKMTVCRYVHLVSEGLASLYGHVINLPEVEDDFKELRNKFHAISRFPMCVGALDCTHVRIQSPDSNIGEMFRNRKGYFSLNVQAVSDAELKFLDVVARWPGSAHDSHIFRNSALRLKMETFGSNVIVADSGYALSHNLITKVPQARTPAENLFNEALIRTRNVVERAFGVLKRRFPVLANGLRVKLDNMEPIIIATAVLHNLAIDLKEAVPTVDNSTQARIDETLFRQREVDAERAVGRGERNPRTRFIQYFNSL